MTADEWLKVALQGGVSLLSGAVGLVVGVWHAGKKSGREEAYLENKIRQDVKKEIDEKIEELRSEMRVAVSEASDNRDLLGSNFREGFDGIRRQIDESRLHTEQNFVRKDAFKEFREENRDDLLRMEGKLDRLLGLKGS